MEPSDLHGKDMGSDTQVRYAVRNEGGVKPTHHARGSKETNELRKSDVLTESVTEDSAEDQQITRKLPLRRAKKGLKRLKGKTGSKTVNQKVVKSKARAVVASLARAADGAMLAWEKTRT